MSINKNQHQSIFTKENLKEDDLILYHYDCYGNTVYHTGIIHTIKNEVVAFYTTHDISDVYEYKMGYHGIAGSECDIKNILMVVDSRNEKDVKKLLETQKEYRRNQNG